MDSLPPNDPNNNNNNNNNNPLGRGAAKEVQSQRRRQRNGNQGPRVNERGEIDLFDSGNTGDDLMIAAMVMMGVAAFLLREVCVC
jgi:hypothetical protein